MLHHVGSSCKFLVTVGLNQVLTAALSLSLFTHDKCTYVKHLRGYCDLGFLQVIVITNEKGTRLNARLEL